MAIAISEIEERMCRMELELHQRIHDAHVNMDGELPKLQHRLEMVKLERRKLASSNPFARAPVRVSDDFVDAFSHNKFSLTDTQLRALEKKEKERGAAQQVAVKKARIEYMQSGAMLCSITDGINLWVARWGDGWVALAEVQGACVERDAFKWDTLCERLKRTNKLETDGEYVRIVT